MVSLTGTHKSNVIRRQRGDINADPYKVPHTSPYGLTIVPGIWDGLYLARSDPKCKLGDEREKLDGGSDDGNPFDKAKLDLRR